MYVPSVAQSDLLRLKGFKPIWTPNGLLFEKNISFDKKSFTYSISNISPDYITNPLVRITSLPEELKNKVLPHVFPNGYLCYYDPEVSFIDPLEPIQELSNCIGQVEQIIQKLAAAENVSDIAQEIQSYWYGHVICILLTDNIKDTISFGYKKIINGKKEQFYIVVNELQDATSWIKKHGGIIDEHKSEITCLTVKVNHNIGSFYDYKEWPPNSIKDFFSWLSIISNNLASNIAIEIARKLKETSRQKILILLITQQGIVGVFVKFNSATINNIKRFIVKKGKKTKKIKNSSLIDILSSKFSHTIFLRVNGYKSSIDFVVSRNTPNSKNFINNRIALVGCGAIGGYLSSFLVQLGAAGGASGRLSLYDGDIFMPDNLGRHILGIGDLFEEKSTALKNRLSENTAYKLNILAEETFTFNEDISRFDLIIDATGNESFSTKLARFVHTKRKDGTKITLIHSWVDAMGHVASALLDDGTSACYRCLREKRNGLLIERLPLFKDSVESDLLPKFSVNCGSTYLPYNSNVSVTAAGLAQQLAIEYINNESIDKFRYIPLSSMVNRHRSRTLEKIKGCPICGE
ncbi:ThiF family adenylyltransferase [Yersinia wautersii]|uniref:UBA/THIF-type NAD/FAD binding protein n=3 Tax=Yersinia pseudotuberculosis TaxID=633 RepID=A0A380Q2V5_YERPU|nr:ThiF family adenylyltransferase [Yersinia pseudotuberculosis]SUP80081.1 UBA/THIF-type NAD/FAD binding protein [Yersinia pseudotuberculosis]